MQKLKITLDAKRIRKDFPIFEKLSNGKRLVYLDSAATAQKPLAVLQALQQFYVKTNANVHRAMYSLSIAATEQYEAARAKVAHFINAKPGEIVFVRNATEGINLVAKSLGSALVNKGDRVVITAMEHHSNLVPWQQLCLARGATLEVVPITSEGTLDMTAFERALKQRPKIVAFTHVSNVLGTINPVNEMTAAAHNAGALVLVDAAQSVPHMPVDVRELDCDFLVFSGHKMCGPTGIGVLYGKREQLERMEPYLVGGEMIKEVSYAATIWNDVPWKFEAGTPNIAGAIALGAAIDYVQDIGLAAIAAHERELTKYALEQLRSVPGLVVYGPRDPAQRMGVIAFNLADIHAHDLVAVLDEERIAVRSGHHCCQPLVEQLSKTGATSRASFYLYNTKEDVDALVAALHKARKVFKL